MGKSNWLTLDFVRGALEKKGLILRQIANSRNWKFIRPNMTQGEVLSDMKGTRTWRFEIELSAILILLLNLIKGCKYDCIIFCILKLILPKPLDERNL